MTRINTNISSLTAQRTLAQSNDQLQQALTRLSTGLRINSGKDDPAGLIASESLRSNIISVQQGITNSQLANQMISTADSAMGQITTLLDDIRGLVSGAANTGAMSSDQIAANQLQIDSSLQAINQIATSTQFQGQRLLDGSLDFLTSGVDSTKLTNVAVNQANLTNGPLNVSAQVSTQATKGALTYTGSSITGDTVLQVGGATGTQAFTFGANSSISQIASAINLVSDSLGVTATASTQQYHNQTTGKVSLASYDTDGASNHSVKYTANNAGQALGNVKIRYTKSATASTTASYVGGSGSTPGVLTVALGTQQATAAVVSGQEAAGTPAAKAIFTLTAKTNGDMYNGITLKVNSSDLGNPAAIGPSFSYDYQNKVITVNNVSTNATTPTTYTALETAWNNAANAKLKALFTFGHGSQWAGGTTVNGANLQTNSATAAGVAGGAVIATAADVIAAVGAGGVNAPVTATAGDSGGTGGVVSQLQESALYNTAVRNGALLFEGPANSPAIRFVNAGANQTLGVDTSQAADVYGTASGTFQASATSFITLTATNAGTAYNGAKLVLNDTGAGTAMTVSYDQTGKTLTVNGDFSGAGQTGQAIVDAINNDTVAGNFFTASVTGTAATAVAGTVGSTFNALTLSGGDVKQRGVLIVNLGTSSTGAITTKASDLVSYFDPTNVASPNLKALGITVQNGVNGDGTASDGSALLTATTPGQDVAMSDNATYSYAKSTGNTVSTAGINASLTVSAKGTGGTYDGVQVKIAQDASSGTTFSYSSLDRTITIHTSGATSATQVATAYNALQDTDSFKQAFLITPNSGGSGGGNVSTSDVGVLSGGATKNADNGIALEGNYDAGYGDTGVQNLLIQANNYGSQSFVSVKAVSGTFATTDSTGAASTRSTGSDIVAQINGIKAVGKGLTASVAASGFDLALTFDPTNITAGQQTSFTINGGGAKFQMGPQVISSQQARLGIQSVNTTNLGGTAGKLYQLQSGGALSLANNVGGAASVVDAVLSQITTLRGRLGAFQKTTLQTNINALNDTLGSLTDAQSSIQDADFAAESANLTRAQILVQSGTSVLSIANKNPENVLKLLQ